MSVSCAKRYQLTVNPSGPCPLPTLKNWTTAAVTGKTLDLTSNGNFSDAIPFQPNSNKVWVIPAAHNGLWYVDTYDVTAASPVPPVSVFAVDVATPQAVAIIYVPGSNKFVIWRQHWNGASYDLWLSFVNGTTGVESSHITGLSTETQNNQFCTVDRNGLTHNYVGWITGNNGIGYTVRLIDADAETVVATNNLGAASPIHGICYSCVTDSFFCVSGTSALVELDRATLNVKNTYLGVLSIGANQPEYIKTTQELWVSPYSTVGNMYADIVDPTTGTYKTTLNLAAPFTGWNGNIGNGYARFYHEQLNAWAIPGPVSNLSGNPFNYYFYDVVSRTLKKSLDITSSYQLFQFGDWWSQSFNSITGSVYLAGGPYRAAGGNSGILEIGTI